MLVVVKGLTLRDGIYWFRQVVPPKLRPLCQDE
jgi:hypothetical protein